ncbi:MAG: hypothetical protein AB1589_45950 [Cyanobacteriota bacterium]
MKAISVESQLYEINGELKASRVGVIVEVRGDRLYLRGTFPPSPVAVKPNPINKILLWAFMPTPLASDAPKLRRLE